MRWSLGKITWWALGKAYDEEHSRSGMRADPRWGKQPTDVCADGGGTQFSPTPTTKKHCVCVCVYQ